MLSVIVANYNNETYIRQCLDSILAQGYKNLEVVVCDDCSTDSSPGIIREYERASRGQVQGIFNSKNKGVAFSRHEAICHARGEYIVTLDSDDYYIDKCKLEKEMALVTAYEKGEKGDRQIMAFSNIMLVKEAAGERKEIIRWGNQKNIKEGFIFDEIITRSCLIPRDFTMSKALYFEVGGYDFRFPMYEDWDLKLRLARKYEFFYTHIDGTAYRRHGKGLSSPPPTVHMEWLKLVFNKNIELEQDRIKQKELTQKFDRFIASLETGKT